MSDTSGLTRLYVQASASKAARAVQQPTGERHTFHNGPPHRNFRLHVVREDERYQLCSVASFGYNILEITIDPHYYGYFPRPTGLTLPVCAAHALKLRSLPLAVTALSGFQSYWKIIQRKATGAQGDKTQIYAAYVYSESPAQAIQWR